MLNEAEEARVSATVERGVVEQRGMVEQRGVVEQRGRVMMSSGSVRLGVQSF